MSEIDKIHVADAYAYRVVGDFLQTMGQDACSEMVSYIVEQIIARLVHVDCYYVDSTIMDNDPKTIELVAKRAHEISVTTAATAMKIINEHRRQEKDACH